jgi:hypothetical protein
VTIKLLSGRYVTTPPGNSNRTYKDIQVTTLSGFEWVTRLAVLVSAISIGYSIFSLVKELHTYQQSISAIIVPLVCFSAARNCGTSIQSHPWAWSRKQSAYRHHIIKPSTPLHAAKFLCYHCKLCIRLSTEAVAYGHIRGSRFSVMTVVTLLSGIYAVSHH